MKYNGWKKPKRRLREIDIEVIEKIKETYSYSWKDIAELLNVSQTQLMRYRACGKAPADRVIALKESLELMIEDEARERRQKVKDIFLSYN